ncbi:fumarylacetoacetase [Pigmentibacter ruber]|uniref:fumarylacetoacetase n=1 Tax=Pigmentibacter ruber TaxID=2683196 RepID=UPI00131D7B9C|nr:fumarylacetoacetase [Pigmentibacter ruber]BFD30957.1 fumarylacetoacetase [Pigmentibacter ruber]
MLELNTWLDVNPKHDFSIYNIPFGIFYTNQNPKNARCGAALGDYIIDLGALFELGYLNHLKNLQLKHFKTDKLNDFLSLGNKTCNAVRTIVQELFSVQNQILKKNSDHLEKILIPMQSAEMLMPIKVGDYVDFYSSLDHATNVGKMFRDEKNPLLPNWKHIPIGYHGRSSSIVTTKTNIIRPKGQLCPPESNQPTFAPSKQLDFELEMAFVTNQDTEMGSVLSPDTAAQYIYGLALFNDWSARDIQRWEYVPLGPFLGKSFASSMSPWLVSLEALAPFSLPNIDKDVEELDYLKASINGRYDITLEVYLKSALMQDEILISKSNYKYMYWTLYQQLAHMSSNGSPIRVGDLYASGTISGPTPDSYGSMLEICWKGSKPLSLPDGTARTFLQDGDSIIFKGYAENSTFRVGFGSLFNTVIST